MKPKYEIGDALYYPLKNEIIKSKVAEIKITEHSIWYTLQCDRNSSESMLFKTFEEAKKFCLDDELQKFTAAVQKINEWKDSSCLC